MSGGRKSFGNRLRLWLRREVDPKRRQAAALQGKCAAGWILVVALFCVVGVSAFGGEFAVYDVFVDAGEEKLAAYQLKISDERAAVKILSVEGGEHASFAEAPRFDPKAIQRDVIKLAAFSLDVAEKLPSGRVRVASLHVEIGPGLTPEWKAVVEAAAGPKGKKISATVSISKRENQ